MYDFPEYHLDTGAQMIHSRGSVLRAPTLHLRGGYQASTAALLGLLCFLRGVAQLVARTAGGREVASSSLVIPTKNKNHFHWAYRS